MTNNSCSNAIKSFFSFRFHDEVLKDLGNLEKIDELTFNKLKLEIMNSLSNSEKHYFPVTQIEKVAYMEAYIEFYSKYPVTSSMVDIHRNLSSKYRRKLSNLLTETDFEKKWTKRGYRKFIFKYYSILRHSSTPKLTMDNFSENVQIFILKRVEQQILMDGFVKRGRVASRIKARVKMMLSFSLNVLMFKEVGAFYSFYDIKLFTPHDELIDKIYKNGLLSVKDEILSQYKLRANIEVTYNQVRPYLILTGISAVATSNYITYEETGDIPLDKRDEIKEFYEMLKFRFYEGLGPKTIKDFEKYLPKPF